jgi:hypothetical protein
MITNAYISTRWSLLRKDKLDVMISLNLSEASNGLQWRHVIVIKSAYDFAIMAQRSEIKKTTGIKIKFNIVGDKYQDDTTLTIVARSPGMGARKNINLAVGKLLVKNTKLGCND